MEVTNAIRSLEDNRQELQSYLKFFRSKQEAILRSVNYEFNEQKSNRLTEEMMSKEEVEDYHQILCNSVKSIVSNEIDSIVNMGALAVNQLLEKAGDYGFELALEPSRCENQALIEALTNMSMSDSGIKSGKRGGGLKDVAADSKETNNKAEYERLVAENRAMNSELAVLRARLNNSERDARDAKSAADANTSGLLLSYSELERALADAKEENAKKVTETAQFVQMKKVMQSQAKHIRDLKSRLQRYEPDDTAEEKA